MTRRPRRGKAERALRSNIRGVTSMEKRYAPESGGSGATTHPEARMPAEPAETPDDSLVVEDKTGARFLRFWYFENGRPISCLVPIRRPEPPGD